MPTHLSLPALREIAATAAACLARHATRLRLGPLLVACSGGADSTALALALAALRDDERLPHRELAIVHLDHGQHDRSREAARAVRALAERLDCRLAERRLELPPGASEDAMRRARYAALLREALGAGAAAVATAHHRDDQCETVLMRLLRGTGPRGLAGIPEWRPLAPGVAVVRPVLGVPRADLLAIVRAAGVPVVEDPTNADVGRTRAAVRHLVLPPLRRRGPADDALAAIASLARTRAAHAESEARRWIEIHVRCPAPWRAELPIPDDLESEVPEEILRLLHVALCGAAPLRSWLRRTVALAGASAGSRVDAGLFAERTRRGLLLVDRRRMGEPPSGPMALPIDGTVVRFGRTEWQIRSGPCPASAPLSNARRTRAVVDAGRISTPMIARRARPGDLLDVAGRRRPVPLREAMTGRHVCRFDRDRVPVVVDAKGRCVWAPGLDVAAFARVGPGTATRCSIEHLAAPGGIALPDSSY